MLNKLGQLNSNKRMCHFKHPHKHITEARDPLIIFND